MKPIRDAVEQARKHRKLPEREAAVMVRYVESDTLPDQAVIVDVKQEWQTNRSRVWLTRTQALNLARSINRKYGVVS